ncbi:MAG: hypothetical protein Q9187_006554 [Circinaria calcarea]
MPQDPQSHGMVIALVIVFTLLALLFVRLRVWARHIKGSQFGIDDYLILASAAFLVVCITIPTLVLAANSHLGDHMLLGPDGMPVPPTYAFNLVLRIFQTTHVVPIMLAKLGILFFYRRIFRGSTFSAITWTTIILVAIWGISFFFSILFECTPIHSSLVMPPGTPGLRCIDQRANFWALSISDVLVDFIILAIPFPFVWNLQMSTRHKCGVSGMFLLGALTITASIARLACFINAGKRLAENDPDFTYYVAPTAYWVLIECSLAIVSACLPVLRPIFHGFSLDTLFRSLASKLTLRSSSTGNSKHISDTYDSLNADSSTQSLSNKLGFSAGVIALPQSHVLDKELSIHRPADRIMVQSEWGAGVNAV